MSLTDSPPSSEQTARIAELKGQLSDRNWRLCNLYWITDRDGKKVRFSPNWAQQRLMEDKHYRNIILKSRQIGFTTFIQLLFLDLILFNSNVRCGTIAQDRDTARALFQDKIKQPYDWLPDGIRAMRPSLRSSAYELALSNNSSIRVGTSLRGGTFQFLHISEFGKVCAKAPDKAREIVTGALNTVVAGQYVFIESTAEGQEGYFYDFTQRARTLERMEARLTEIDYKFHFYGWWEDPACSVDPDGVIITENAQKHFELLEREHAIYLKPGQKAWWTITKNTQRDDMGREYPAHPDEAFASAVDGAYYGKEIANIEKLGRIGKVKADPRFPVQTYHDIGVSDYHSIWFAQTLPGEIRHLHYYQNSGEGLPHYARYIKAQYEANPDWRRETEQGLAYDWFPHDGRVMEWGTGKSRMEQAVGEGLRPKIPPTLSLMDGINAVRDILPMSTFDAEGCEAGIAALKNYKKQWNDQTGAWRDAPLHNEASHGADAERTLACAHRDVELSVLDPEKARQREIERALQQRLKERQTRNRSKRRA